MKVLVINAGSSSIKYQLFEMPEQKVLAKGVLEKIGEENSVLSHKTDDKTVQFTQPIQNHELGMQLITKILTDPKIGVIKNIAEISAVGHRVVHGGEKFTGSCLITKEVIDAIQEYADLAPLHNPPNLTGIKAATAILPNIPQVAAFDTAFHQTMPKYAYIYGIPYEYYEKYKVRRYGFHGTSHRYVARRAAVLLGKNKTEANIITCHLGNGCSITAVLAGNSVDNSMGLTPLEGLVMGTRAGDIDPGLIFYLAERLQLSIPQITQILNKKSGLLGISGISNDVRNLLEEADKGNERAKLAIDVFCYRVKKYIGAYMAVLGRTDAIVFTGGIGENATSLREKICDNLDWFGIILDRELNAKTQRIEQCISAPESRVKVFVIPTDEEARIAFDTCEIATKLNNKKI
ncbi:MAG: acetate kinase [bacterium]|nr:acetate kinase [bacterium]